MNCKVSFVRSNFVDIIVMISVNNINLWEYYDFIQRYKFPHEEIDDSFRVRGLRSDFA